MVKSDKWPKDRKLTKNEKKAITDAIPRSKAKAFADFHLSNLSLCHYISQKVNIPERRVAGYIAYCTRDWHKDTPAMRQLIQELDQSDPPPEGMSKSSHYSKIIGISEYKVRKFIADLSRTENCLLAIDCTYKTNECLSEADHLKQLFLILDNKCYPSKLRPAQGQTHSLFMETLMGATERHIHISAHGNHTRKMEP